MHFSCVVKLKKYLAHNFPNPSKIAINLEMLILSLLLVQRTEYHIRGWEPNKQYEELCLNATVLIVLV